VFYHAIEHFVRGKTNGVPEVLALQVLVDFGVGKRGIAAEKTFEKLLSVSLNHGFQNSLLVFRAVDVASAEHCPLQVAKLVEAEQRMVASPPEVTVVRGTLLLPMRRTLRTVHVEDQFLHSSATIGPLNPLPAQVHQPGKVLVRRQHLGLEATHLAARRRQSFLCPAANYLSHRWIEP